MGYRKKNIGLQGDHDTRPGGASFEKWDPPNVGDAGAQLPLNFFTSKNSDPSKIFHAKNSISEERFVVSPSDRHVQPPIEKFRRPLENSYNFENCATRIATATPPYPIYEVDVIKALEYCEGNIYEAAVLLGRKRNNLKIFIEANIAAMDALNEQKEILLDKTEKTLFETALVSRDPATLRFIMSTLGRNRGYTPEVRHASPDGGPLQFELVLHDAPTSIPENKQLEQNQMLDEFLRGEKR